MSRLSSLRFAALSACAAMGFASASPAAELAGVSAAVRGSVELARAQEAARGVASGEKIYLADALRSGGDSGMQVLLLDETVFTLGPDSEIAIDEFVYDPKSRKGKLDAQIVRGVFRFVSGRIAKDRPDDVRLRLPTGTIGIRGTIVAGKVEDDGSAVIVLLGPGRNANGQDRVGAVRIESGGRTVDLVRANWATRLPAGGGPPSDPFQMKLPELVKIEGDLEAQPPAPKPRVQAKRNRPRPQAVLAAAPTNAPTATKISGQGTAVGAQFSKQILADVGQLTNVNQVDTVAGQLPFQGGVQIATIEQLNAINTGMAVYNQPGVSFASGGGFDFGFVLDFGQQLASFGMQNITSPVLGLFPGNGVVLNAVATDFAAGNGGNAIFAIPTSFNHSPSCLPCFVLVNADVLNVNGQVAAEIAAKVSVSQPGGPVLTGDLGRIPGFFVP